MRIPTQSKHCLTIASFGETRDKYFLESRISPSMYSLIKSRGRTAEEPQNVDACITFVERWIVMHTKHTGPRIACLQDDANAGQGGASQQAAAQARLPPGIPQQDSLTDVGDINVLSAKGNAGRLAGGGKQPWKRGQQGNKDKGGGKSGKPPLGVTACDICWVYHLDVKTCPSLLARQDAKYQKKPGVTCN